VARRFYWIDPFSYAQKAIAVNEFSTARWQSQSTPAGASLGDTILDQRGLPHERWWIWCTPCALAHPYAAAVRGRAPLCDGYGTLL
jgi:hypothetical protein